MFFIDSLIKTKKNTKNDLNGGSETEVAENKDKKRISDSEFKRLFYTYIITTPMIYILAYYMTDHFDNNPYVIFGFPVLFCFFIVLMLVVQKNSKNKSEELE